MYGKFFASAFTGSMYGAGADVFAVWGYVIANTVAAQVELNPAMLAGVIGMSPERAQAAIDFLCAPDPNSRSKVAEGRRLIREGQFAYHVPNHETYRSVKNEDDRREYNRIKKAEERARKSNSVKPRVIELSAVSAQAEADTETEAEAYSSSSPARGRLPERCHTAYDALTRASRSPDAWQAVVTAYLDGQRTPMASPDIMALALEDMHIAGAQPTGSVLKGFLRKAAAVDTVSVNGHPLTESEKFLRGMV